MSLSLDIFLLGWSDGPQKTLSDARILGAESGKRPGSSQLSGCIHPLKPPLFSIWEPSPQLGLGTSSPEALSFILSREQHSRLLLGKGEASPSLALAAGGHLGMNLCLKPVYKCTHYFGA